MPFSAKEKELISKVTKRQSELDIDFIFKTAAQFLSGKSSKDQIEMVVSTLHNISTICANGAQAAADSVLERDDITVDSAMDAVRQFVETSALMSAIADSVEEIYKDQDIVSINESAAKIFMEGMRLDLVREKAQQRKTRKPVG